MKRTIIFLSGIVILFYGIYLSSLPIFLKIIGKSTTGIVVSLHGKYNGGNSFRDIKSRRSLIGIGKHPSIKFLPINAIDSVSFTAKGGGLLFTHYQIGEHVTVVYSSKDPSLMSIFTFTELGSGFL